VPVVSDADIEDAVRRYVADAIRGSEVPTRGMAIRQITGELNILPSAVAKTMTRMIEAGALKHGQGDRIYILDQPAAQ
jgi:hypothetical protein